MARWWKEHAEGRETNVHPDPAEFGLDLDELRDRFSTYTDRMREWTRR
jgi:hypothetical protein